MAGTTARPGLALGQLFSDVIADAYAVFADRAASAKTPGTKQKLTGSTSCASPRAVPPRGPQNGCAGGQ